MNLNFNKVKKLFDNFSECENGIMVGETCFFALYDVIRDFQGAVVECKLNGGQLAFVDSLETFRQIEEHLRTEVVADGDNYKYYWTGHLYDPLVSLLQNVFIFESFEILFNLKFKLFIHITLLHLVFKRFRNKNIFFWCY